MVKFLCDHMLGTLARWLRFLGYDTAYPKTLSDNELKALAAAEGRVLLTRDRELSARVSDGMFLVSDDPDEQLLAVVQRFRLTDENALTRCSVCNASIHRVPKDEARDRVPDGVHDRQDEFWRCEQCGRFYWQGSHFERLRAKVRVVVERTNPES